MQKFNTQSTNSITKIILSENISWVSEQECK